MNSIDQAYHNERRVKALEAELAKAHQRIRELEAPRPSLVPYPEFCHHPDKCKGLSGCPRDPVCND